MSNSQCTQCCFLSEADAWVFKHCLLASLGKGRRKEKQLPPKPMGEEITSLPGQGLPGACLAQPASWATPALWGHPNASAAVREAALWGPETQAWWSQRAAAAATVPSHHLGPLLLIREEKKNLHPHKRTQTVLSCWPAWWGEMGRELREREALSSGPPSRMYVNAAKYNRQQQVTVR